MKKSVVIELEDSLEILILIRKIQLGLIIIEKTKGSERNNQNHVVKMCGMVCDRVCLVKRQITRCAGVLFLLVAGSCQTSYFFLFVLVSFYFSTWASRNKNIWHALHQRDGPNCVYWNYGTSFFLLYFLNQNFILLYNT